MKICILAAVLLISCNFLHAQSLDKGYYIVVGAFAATKESYAQKFVESIKTQGLNAKYALDSKRKLFLVYLEEFTELPPSLKEMQTVRQHGKFPEAWVRIIKESEKLIVKNEELNVKSEKLKAEPEQSSEERPEQVTQKVTTSSPPPDTTSSRPPILTSSSPQVVTSSAPPVKTPPTPQEIPVVFHMFDANNSRPVDGNIEIVDTDRARLIQENKSTDTLKLPDPKSNTGMLSLITDVFGYRKLQHEVSYKQPLVDSAKHYFDREGDFYVVQLEMVRYHKGDIATLYNVFFFNDAAVMMPESKYELNKLLDMMKSNSNYRIRLHGHTNGNSHGKIISMGPSKEFFRVNATDVKQGAGSAKELSGQRAEVIREWLIAQEISGDRIEVKAWGGRRMIHDKNSNNARKNVRVEVEVLNE